MMDLRASAEWRLLSCNWIALAVMALALALALALTGFWLKAQSALLPLGFAGGFAAVAYLSAVPRNWCRGAFVFGTSAQLVLVTALMSPLTYIAAAVDLPLQDANLAAIDQTLGLDWRAYLAFVNDRPTLIAYLAFGYAMIAWPIFGVPVLLGVTKRYRRLQQFTLAFTLALMATTIVSTLAPALGAYYGLHIAPSEYAHFTPGGYFDQLRDFPRVRDGSLRELDITHLVGIITFPSFHAAAAVLYLWAFWSIWWMRPIALAANGLMLAATPIGGGHYFVDVFAGIGVAVLAIAAARWICKRLVEGAAQPASAPVPSAVAVPAE
jgi:PAP2 superfamily